MSNKPMPPESTQWLAIIKATLRPEEELNLLLAQYNQRIVMLMIHTLALLRARDFEGATTALPSILDELDSAERDLVDWTAQHQDVVHADPDALPVTRHVVNCLRASRIKMHCFVVLLLNFVQNAPPGEVSVAYDPSFLEERRAASLAIVAQASREIVETSFLVLLGYRDPDMIDEQTGMLPGFSKTREASARPPPESWFNALQLVWPLTVVLCVVVVPRATRMQARYALGIIGRQRGIMQALRSYRGGIALPEEATRGLGRDDICNPPPVAAIQ